MLKTDCTKDRRLRPHELLGIFGDFVMWLCLSYTRMRPSESFNTQDGISVPSRSEMLGRIRVFTAEQWQARLDEEHIPSSEQCLNHAREVLQRIEDLCQREDEKNKGVNACHVIPMDDLRRAFGLTDAELYFLMIAAVSQHDEAVQRAICAATGRPTGSLVQVNFILNALEPLGFEKGDLLEIVNVTGTLRRYGLVLFGDDPRYASQTPIECAAVIVPQRVCQFLLGHAPLHAPDGCKVLSADGSPETIFEAKPCDAEILSHLEGRSRRLTLVGADGLAGKASLLRAAKTLGLSALSLDLHRFYEINVGKSVHEICENIAIIFREARLTNSMLVLCAHSCTSESNKWLREQTVTFQEQIALEPDLRICHCLGRNAANTRLFSNFPEIIYPNPTSKEQAQFWAQALSRYMTKSQASPIVDVMSSQFILTFEDVQEAVELTRSRFANYLANEALSIETLAETLNRLNAAELENLAILRTTTLYLYDLVLSDETIRVLKQALRSAKNRDCVMNQWGMAKYSNSAGGLGILFTGSPGTGKSLTAIVFGRELGRDVYQVDLSQIVDKHVGETEKNLTRIFDNAAKSRAILLFDEADALFGKRTAIKSSNDKYANLEMNHILQLIERYPGVTILTSNFSSAFDDALMRRLKFKIHFPKPTFDDRALLWEVLLPEKAPLGNDFQYELYAEVFHEMAGAHIYNAIQRACYDVPPGGVLNHDILWAAAVREYREMGHTVRDDEHDSD